ncbi:MAG: hypothetical protein DWQ06_14910 [Calditrichaeota bacterium]|nr:MAG: hypothetical protein DWQ06_14910 [Calditrichota bacterium]
MKFKIYEILSFLILVSCAKVEPPTGGPEDTVQPEILEFSPQDRSTNISPLPEIKIKFSEKMNNENVEQNVYFVPEVEEIDFSWTGYTFYVSPKDSLLKNKTYTFNLAPGIEDYHKVKTDSDFKIAFSTGDTIDSLFISGKTEKASRVVVWCFEVEEDSVFFPKKEKIVSYTKADLEGNFSIENLPSGNFRIFAFTDSNKDDKFTRSKEKFAVYHKDISLNAENISEENLRLFFTENDTTQLIVRNIVPVYDTRFRVNFNREPIEISKDYLKIISADSTQEVQVEDFYFNPNDSLQMIVEVESMDSTKYIFDYTKLVYAQVNKPKEDTTFTFKFTGFSKKDSFYPKPVKFFPKEKSVLLPETKIQVWFDEPLNENRLNQISSVIAKNKTDSLTIKKIFKTNKNQTFLNIFEIPKKDSTEIRILFNETSLSDKFANLNTDTTLTISYLTPNPVKYSTVSGKIKTQSDLKNSVFSLVPINQKTGIELKLDSENRFKSNFVKPGSYLPMIFEDRNQNQKLDLGLDFPFQFSEKFHIWETDTLIFKENWEYDEIELKLEDY